VKKKERQSLKELFVGVRGGGRRVVPGVVVWSNQSALVLEFRQLPWYIPAPASLCQCYPPIIISVENKTCIMQVILKLFR
jgi:hypothetical protein